MCYLNVNYKVNSYYAIVAIEAAEKRAIVA